MVGDRLNKMLMVRRWARVTMTYFQPLKQLEIEHRAIRHVGQGIISKKGAADIVESSSEMCQCGRMHQIIAGLTTAWSV
jgi:hypothetical protein